MKNILEIITEEISEFKARNLHEVIIENKIDWAVFRISKGQKYYITSLTPIGIINAYDYDVKYSDDEVPKFTVDDAVSIIKKNIDTCDKYGIVNSKGVQKLYDWKIRYDNGLN